MWKSHERKLEKGILQIIENVRKLESVSQSTSNKIESEKNVRNTESKKISDMVQDRKLI